MKYIVQPGDSLYEIAMQFNITVGDLINSNPQISNPNRIYVGQRIEVDNQWGITPWGGSEWRISFEEYQRGMEAYRKGRAAIRKGRAAYHKGRKEYAKYHR